MYRLASLWVSLGLISCFGASDHSLFDRSPAPVAAGGANGTTGGTTGGTVPAQAGSDSGAQPATAGTATAGSGGSGQGGSAGASGQAAAGADGSSGARQEPPTQVDACSQVEGAVTSELNGHCYRVDTNELNFKQARAACEQAGGHLLTIGSKEEDDFAEQLHDGEHWIGATDGLADTAPGVGTYVWVADEEWGYTDWEDGQPNAYETDCPDQSGEVDCFEHCAFQTDEGDWNDRSCWHEIASICEWDIEAAGGAAGSAS